MSKKNVPQARKITPTHPRARGGEEPRKHPGPAGGHTPGWTRFRARYPVLSALVPVLVVVFAIATMAVIKVASSASAPRASQLDAGGPAATNDRGAASLPSSIVNALSVPGTTLDAVGTPASVAPPSTVSGSAPVLLGATGKPEILYVGAEYCPYCAAERWAIAVALSRFGTFSNLSGTNSAADDVYPDTQTLSFNGSTYTSAYLDFQAVEEATNQRSGETYRTLQSPSAAQAALLNRYDQAGSIPFLDIGNKYVITGASFSPQVLQGLSRSQIAEQLNDPSSPVAQQIDGAANYITAAIREVPATQPAGVAGSSVIAGIAQRLGA